MRVEVKNDLASRGPMHKKFWLILTLIATIGSPTFLPAERSLLSDPEVIFEDPVNRALGQQAHHEMWLFLSDSKITWIRTAAALHFIRKPSFIREPDPELRDEGERLAAGILAGEPRDAHTLWLLLDVCHSAPELDGCATATLGDRLIEAAPDNAAVYLKGAGMTAEWKGGDVEDTEEAREALLRAARANSFDIYYGRNALELYHELKAFEEGYQPTHEPAIDLSEHARAGGGVWTVFSLLPLTGLGGIIQLCEAQVREGRPAHVGACLTLAATMQNTGKALITRSLGYSLERKVMEAMGVDEAITLYLFRKGRMSVHVRSCQLPSWMRNGDAWPELDEATVVDYLRDLDTLGEVGAIRNRAIREYQVNPEAYEQDPELCEALLDLDSDSMGAVLGKMDPKRLMESESE